LACVRGGRGLTFSVRDFHDQQRCGKGQRAHKARRRSPRFSVSGEQAEAWTPMRFMGSLHYSRIPHRDHEPAQVGVPASQAGGWAAREYARPTRMFLESGHDAICAIWRPGQPTDAPSGPV
jgi:hypothetical protein